MLGTLISLSSFSERKLVDKLIKSAALLSPVAYLTHMTTPARIASGSPRSGHHLYASEMWKGT
ncbi:hypothetical protein MUK42_04780 [Musa troglodytarum]|uniref:Uncharacterized protein n=1 Tax=Musa troglodytarum TaxID=320322 RepID=A0A9E7I3Q5_9LILI|nr:hypothetical protein MUK42_04780 [Musa troglodytarum]